MAQKKVKVTSTAIELPGNTVLYIPNHVTNGQYKDFSLIQSKLFGHVIKLLQIATKSDMEGKDYQQLDLFDKIAGNIKLVVPLSIITTHDYYKEVYEAARALRQIEIKFELPKRGGWIAYAGLFAMVLEPKMIKGKSCIEIILLKDVAEQLIKIEKDPSTGAIKNYTKYLHEVAVGAKCKYTLKMYWILSSWVGKGSFTYSYEKLREQLGISNLKNEEDNYIEYPEFKNFKANVLLPIQKDLEKKSHCWFDCQAPGFETRSAKKVTHLNFKLITPQYQVLKNERADNIRQLLRLHHGFDTAMLEQLRPIFATNFNFQAVQEKIIELHQYVTDKKNQVTNRQAYMIKSLLNQFCTNENDTKKILS